MGWAHCISTLLSQPPGIWGEPEGGCLVGQERTQRSRHTQERGKGTAGRDDSAALSSGAGGLQEAGILPC